MILGNGIKMIHLTSAAIAQLKKISLEEEIGHLSVRITIKGGGCSGFITDMYFDEIIKEMDEIIEQDEIKIVIDPMSFQYFDGTEIDYVDTLISSGFKFNNPNATGTCGCGKSQSY
jgi:iron-sulfur cluster insertion protein